MPESSANIFEPVPTNLPEEVSEILVKSDSVRIERIVSRGHHSPDSFWCDQDTAEWVILLKGHAKLEFEEDSKLLELKPGNFLNISAHQKHRVQWTDPDRDTVWLAVHYQ